MKQKSAMLLLKEDLIETITTGKEALNDIKDVNIKSACKTTLELTIKDIIKRIDEELFEVEKNQMRRIYNQGNTWASEIGSEEFFNQDYTQSSE
jgi:hypothetical protein